VKARGLSFRVVGLRLPGKTGRQLRSGALLATERTTIDGPSFDAWLGSDDAKRIPL
jgi:hypothetical protein